MTKAPCPICNLEKKTRWYYEDENVIICDCMSCRIPMLVLKEHGHIPSPVEREELLKLVKKLFGENAQFRGYASTYLEHWHEHIIFNVKG